MKLVQMNIEHNITPEQFKAGAADTKKFAEMLAQQPGVLWKIWIGASDRNEVGGIWLFESEKAAKDFLSGPIFAQVESNPGFKKIEVKMFDVDEFHSAITRAPLPSLAKV